MKYQKTLEQTIKLASKFKFAMSMAELMEKSALENIFYYCRQKRYQINDFPQLGRRILNTEEFEIIQPKIINYLKIVAIEKDSIAELVWTYFSEFYPNRYSTKEEMISIFESEIAFGEVYV
jgi:hypothetical protein